MRWKRRKKTPLDLLIRKIRKSSKYIKWRRAVLDEWDFPDNVKGVQVHHKTEIKTFLKERKITSYKKAMRCKELWKTDLGVPLTRGEHAIITKLSRHKYLTPGFVMELLNFLKTRHVRIAKGKAKGFNKWASEMSIRVRFAKGTLGKLTSNKE